MATGGVDSHEADRLLFYESHLRRVINIHDADLTKLCGTIDLRSVSNSKECTLLVRAGREVRCELSIECIEDGGFRRQLLTVLI